MAPLPSEIYKTIKRSISGSNVFGNHSTTSQSPRFINKWIHPPGYYFEIQFFRSTFVF